MKNIFYFFLSILSILVMASCSKRDVEVQSPDGQTRMRLAVNESGSPLYCVEQDGAELIAPSELGMIIRRADDTDRIDLTSGWRMTGTERRSHDETWQTVWGEDEWIRDQYNELTVHLKHSTGLCMDLYMRAYDEGIALRYCFPEQSGWDSIVIMDERTSYRLPSGTQAWSIPWRTEYYEALWERDELCDKDTMCSPVTLELPNGRYAFVHEANLTDYPAQNLYISNGAMHTFLTPWLDDAGREKEDKCYARLPLCSPWRMVVLTRNLQGLVSSRMLLNLNEPCKIEDTSWIKPMKFVGIWWGMHLHQWTWRKGPKHGATTANTKRYLEFAASHNIGGVLVEGWNTGWEGYEGIDPNARFSFVTPYSDYDIDYLSRYALEHGVQLIFHHETSGQAAQYESEMAEAYDYMTAHGMHAVKTGYVAPIIATRDGHQYNRSQSGVRHYRRVIECAAAHRVCIDNHEPVMPTGLQRTYPNLMTQEGIRGQEWNAWSTDGGSPASHVCTLPFTRMLAGPADYTPGVFGFENPVYPNTRVHGTIANQLALFVTLYSPLQMACDLVENYERRADAFRFIEQVPCDWHRSLLLDGKIGEYVAIARQDRNSSRWFIGATTDDTPRRLTLPLNFLDADKQYTATIYSDGENADWRTAPYDYVISEKCVTCADKLDVQLASGGGCAIVLQER